MMAAVREGCRDEDLEHGVSQGVGVKENGTLTAMGITPSMDEGHGDD